ncbi:hypothetical protein KIW84_046337 [Lathyrus oleraceus]|uniref:Uncharacterized protein n=1 Tax=Pisum sativum TaxID=3888 RepID=A0A9D4XQR2_PEA|nr:hypothetical protein KIW84_046337 [Pisum sativum]
MDGEEEDEQVISEEVEAMKSVYENDCTILNSIPPHFHLSLKPRTADVSSHQFVEIVLEVHATPQYPKEPPSVAIVDCKGLDQHRQKHLLNHIQTKANELSPGLMLVALCEEAVEKLSDMNHPDGDCPLCLFPLVTEEHQSETLPFMKLMSCFHCFHSECIIRWWNWLESSKQTGSSKSDNATARRNRDNHEKLEEGAGNCPVCRKPFHAKDLDHVLDLVGSHSSRESLNSEVDNEENILQSEDEIIRKQRFEAILSLQKENNGLIEPKKDIVILPGMYLQQPVAVPDSTSTKEPNETEQQHESDPPAVGSGKHVSGTSNGPSSSGNRNFGARRHRPRDDNHHSSSTARPRDDHHHSSSTARPRDDHHHSSSTARPRDDHHHFSSTARPRDDHHHSSSTARPRDDHHHSSSTARPRGDHHQSSSTARPRGDHHQSSSTVRHPRKPVQQWVRRDTPCGKQ